MIKGCLKGKFGRGVQICEGGVQIRCDTGRFNTSLISWSSKSFRARIRCSLFALIKFCAMIHTSHQNSQHWKQYELCLLLLSQFAHYTPAVWHSLMPSTSSKLFIRKFVGRSLRFPPLGTWTSFRHSGHAKMSWRPLVRKIPFKQWRQKLCKHDSIFGHTNRAGYFFMKIVEQGFYIHD